ncbi:MAG: CCA tRNA nucleotidyltransferase [Candidatus Izemoplasmatales bacterium]
MNRLELGKEVILKLHEQGYLAYFVGGFVRDFLLGIPSDDIDITTSCRPENVLSLFEGSKATGIKYGTVTVFHKGESFEVTTFRMDGLYQNHRHPEDVEYSTKLDEDLVRRDFTMNALAMDIHGEIVDLFNGLDDMRNHLIRAVGDPDRRFSEDALRILRAFRFVSKLDFVIEKHTKKAIFDQKELILTLANERIIQEMTKIIRYPYVNHAFKKMIDIGIDQLLPSLREGIQFLVSTDQQLHDKLEFFTLCFYLSHGEVDESWRFSNKEKRLMSEAINLMSVTQEDEFQLLHVYTFKKEVCLLANKLNVILNPSNNQEERILSIDASLPIRKTCDLAFKGGDILALTDLKDAEIIGDIIDDIIYKVLHQELRNDYQELKEYTMKTYFKK